MVTVTFEEAEVKALLAERSPKAAWSEIAGLELAAAREKLKQALEAQQATFLQLKIATESTIEQHCPSCLSPILIGQEVATASDGVVVHSECHKDFVR